MSFGQGIVRYYVSNLQDDPATRGYASMCEFRPFDPLDGPVLVGRVIWAEADIELFDVFDIFRDQNDKLAFYNVHDADGSKVKIQVHGPREVEANT